ncbi:MULTISPECIES: cupin domain-containing protein [Streptomyces]|uniref:Cupin domain-containing protein n=2 Tax=Streptomyces TaxID=1883 RepID=A0A2U9PC29_STRAS|nr:cupin domain-containing protein [Streptomyces actuosus]AWT47217.1 cupin domain-containing protein [Streptomyces actuosus]MBM4823585.1 cupin domain-containing protein [Streptomyces actuosus]
MSTHSSGTALVVPLHDAEVVPLAGAGAFRLLADGTAADGALGVNRLSLETGADGARPHYHARSSEMFYVLGGTACFLLGERLVTVDAGGLVVVPPGLPHAFGAAPAATADLLVVAAPGSDRFDYFRRLGRISRGEETFADLLPEQERYDVHFVDATLWRSVRAR